jgi:hypothetical protein
MLLSSCLTVKAVSGIIRIVFVRIPIVRIRTARARSTGVMTAMAVLTTLNHQISGINYFTLKSLIRIQIETTLSINCNVQKSIVLHIQFVVTSS